MDKISECELHLIPQSSWDTYCYKLKTLEQIKNKNLVLE